MAVPTFPTAAEARHEEGFLPSSDGARIYWQRHLPPAPPRATVAVLHGAGDHSGRYPGITSALVRAGFEVALLDFRGHGQSDGRRWHVDAARDEHRAHEQSSKAHVELLGLTDRSATRWPRRLAYKRYARVLASRTRERSHLLGLRTRLREIARVDGDGWGNCSPATVPGGP